VNITGVIKSTKTWNLVAEYVVAWARVPDMRSLGKPLRAVFLLRYLLFGHSVLFGRYFNVDSNKLSNKKQENAKFLTQRELQT
jgi:hypothetical protein